MINTNCTVAEALKLFNKYRTQMILVTDGQQIIGYTDVYATISQFEHIPNLDQLIEIKDDILKVPENSPVGFYHNISVILGVNSIGEETGFCSVDEAKNSLTKFNLQHMNQTLNSSGLGIITTDSHFKIQFMNEKAEEILGLSQSFLLNRNYRTLLEVDSNLEEVLIGKQFVSVDSTINYKNISGNFSPLMQEGKICGIVHAFILSEEWKHTIQELKYVKSLYDDLQAIYSSSHEQILVVDSMGQIMRVGGKFLSDFWSMDTPDSLIGRNISEFEQDGVFQPNIVELCSKKGQKLSCVQETNKERRIWSVATPIYYNDKLEKVIVISRDISEMNQLQQELEIVKRKTDEYKQELDQFKNKKGLKKKIIYRSKVMENLIDGLKRIAMVDSTVLLNGESGVGKEVFANAIHELGKRKDQPFIRVNCGAIPSSLIESELFGYEKGAFTGADQKGKPGFFELANCGTIFLDEISELPLNMQVKLLRVLQEKEMIRVGGVRTVKVDIRIIAATNRNLLELVKEDKFREDLYYRLNVIPIEVPPLRKRAEDIVPLSIHFLQQVNQGYQLEKSLSREALEVLENYHWPGNVRELQNIIERLIVTTKGDFVNREDVLDILYKKAEEVRAKPIVFELMPLKDAVEELEIQLIKLGLQKYGTAAKVSEVLGVSKATISRRMNKLLIEKR
jgi:transcriptional regulator with PAS, ATPase and Fis domain